MSATIAPQPHHDGSALYLDDPAPAIGDRVGVRLRLPAGWSADAVHVRSVVDAEPTYTAARLLRRDPGDDGAAWWQGEVVVGNPTASYRFLIETPGGPRWVNGAGTWTRDVADRDDFVVSTYPPPPDWLADSVVYEIFPDRFARSAASSTEPVPAGDWAIESDWETPVESAWNLAVRQLYRGDLAGVRERLDHLERLGVNLIYLTPFFPGRSAHRYDAATFDHVDPVLGGDAALAALTDAAHARGIRVIGDLTTNHSGSHHQWFETAQADALAPEAGFYFFNEHPDDYVGWFDVPTLPKLDLRSPALRHMLIEGRSSVGGRWLAGSDGAADLDGWRIDVANMTGRLGAIDVNHEVATTLRTTMADVRRDGWLVAEHCYDATADLRGDGWHGVMAYTWFTRPVWSWLAVADAKLLGIPGGLPPIGGVELAETFRAITAGVPWRSVTASMTLLDSHDTPRFATTARSGDHRHVGIGLLMTMPGVPMVFAGDEVGVGGATSDLARQPFPWDETTWDHDSFEAYRALIALRRSSPALCRGGIRFVGGGPDALAFVRETPDERVLVLACRAAGEPLTARRGDVGLTAGADRLYGEGDLNVDGGRVTFGAAPGVTVWRLS